MEIQISIPGKPIAKKRPKFYRRGGFVGAYNAQETEEGKFQLLANSQIKLAEPLTGPIGLDCIFYMPIPSGTSKVKIDRMTKFDVPHVKKPDLDNMLKFVKDCLNGIAWKDDSQVARIEACKVYGSNPRTDITIIYEEVLP